MLTSSAEFLIWEESVQSFTLGYDVRYACFVDALYPVKEVHSHSFLRLIKDCLHTKALWPLRWCGSTLSLCLHRSTPLEGVRGQSCGDPSEALGVSLTPYSSQASYRLPS